MATSCPVTVSATPAQPLPPPARTHHPWGYSGEPCYVYVGRNRPQRLSVSAPTRSRFPKRKLRVLPFVLRDKFQHRRLATIYCCQTALEGRDNLLRIGDSFTVRAHGLCDLRELTG